VHTDTRSKLEAITRGDLGFHGADTGYATHNFHAFPAKFPPQLPRAFIRALTEPGDLVLDPMAGSGTTLVEAYLAGRRTLGVDIDPLALLLCRVKTRAHDAAALRETGAAICARARALLAKGEALDIRDRFDAETADFIDFWFAPRTQRELLALLLAIEHEAAPGQRDFFYLVFSSIIITKTGGVSMARDLAHTRPHRVNEKRPRRAVDVFGARLKHNLKRLADLTPPRVPVRVLRGDARALPLEAGQVDLIVTSPPYAANAIDYMRAHKFSLVWLGYPMNDLVAMRSQYLGGDRVRGAVYGPLPQGCRAIVDRVKAADSHKGRVFHRYLTEMAQALHEMHRVLRPGGAAVIVVGTSTLRGVNVETHNCLAEIAQDAAGFDLVDVAERRMDRDRRMMPARFGHKRSSQIEQRMHREYVLALYKPAGPSLAPVERAAEVEEA
jgi:DNA modification methylase